MSVILLVVGIVLAQMVKVNGWDLPFQLDIAVYGCIFMIIGNVIKSKEWLDNLNVAGTVVILFVGVYAIFSNTRVDLHDGMTGNIVLLYIGASALSITLFWMAKKCQKDNFAFRFMNFFGKNTLIIMGFYIIIKRWLPYFWKRIPGLDANGIGWYCDYVIVVSICSIIIIAKKQIEKCVLK